MKTITYNGPFEEVTVLADRETGREQTCKRGESVDVTDEIAAALIESAMNPDGHQWSE